RVPLRGPHLDAVRAEAAEVLHQELGVLHHVRLVARIARDRRDLHPLRELLEEARAVRVDVREDVLHASSCLEVGLLRKSAARLTWRGGRAPRAPARRAALDSRARPWPRRRGPLRSGGSPYA